jgi:hypothetical protein
MVVHLNPPAPKISGPEPLTLEGIHGLRYWVYHPFTFIGHPVVDQRLSGFPVAVFLPKGRKPEETPLVIGLQGMAVPYQWNVFILPTLLDMGIACALFDTPMAGERSLARNHLGDVLTEVVALMEYEVSVGPPLLPRIMRAVARDYGTVLRIVKENHGIGDERLALFGVSLGTLISSFAFMRDGIGQRLLGTIGHADLPRFARSYSPIFTPWFRALPARAIIRFFSLLTGANWLNPRVDFLVLLSELCTEGKHCRTANPMIFAEKVGKDRRVRFLVGDADPLVRKEDAIACAKRFPDGEAYVVPGMSHGDGGFIEHVRTYLGTQLGDWKW